MNDSPATPETPFADDIYRADFVRGLFDEMSRTYGTVNLLSSFGFCVLWRRQCVAQLAWRPGMVVYDLMSGMGELWPNITNRFGGPAEIVAVDFSREMCARSLPVAKRLAKIAAARITVIEEDILANSIPASSADAVVSSFGLKTFSPLQRERLAAELARILRPGGKFSFLEISVPRLRLLRAPYMFYVSLIVPLLGKLLLGNPDNYRLLGVYTNAFRNCDEFAAHCQTNGLRVVRRCYFFGCATGVVGEKPS